MRMRWLARDGPSYANAAGSNDKITSVILRSIGARSLLASLYQRCQTRAHLFCSTADVTCIALTEKTKPCKHCTQELGHIAAPVGGTVENHPGLTWASVPYRVPCTRALRRVVAMITPPVSWNLAQSCGDRSLYQAGIATWRRYPGNSHEERCICSPLDRHPGRHWGSCGLLL